MFYCVVNWSIGGGKCYWLEYPVQCPSEWSQSRAAFREAEAAFKCSIKSGPLFRISLSIASFILAFALIHCFVSIEKVCLRKSALLFLFFSFLLSLFSSFSFAATYLNAGGEATKENHHTDSAKEKCGNELWWLANILVNCNIFSLPLCFDGAPIAHPSPYPSLHPFIIQFHSFSFLFLEQAMLDCEQYCLPCSFFLIILPCTLSGPFLRSNFKPKMGPFKFSTAPRWDCCSCFAWNFLWKRVLACECDTFQQLRNK